MKMHRYPLLDWGKMFSSMVECRVSERQFLITALYWLKDSVCSYSCMWNKSNFQLLYLVFVSSVDPFAWNRFKKKKTFWLLDCTVNILVWELSLLCSWRCLSAGAQPDLPVQHMEHITLRSHLLKQKSCHFLHMHSKKIGEMGYLRHFQSQRLLKYWGK